MHTSQVSEEWYENRIKWRAEKRLLKQGALLWDNTDHTIRGTIETYDIPGRPLLLLFDRDDLWTVISSSHICSLIDGVFSCIHLDEAKANLAIENISQPPQNSDKVIASILVDRRSNRRYWTAPGAQTFSVLNLLYMFPLRANAHRKV